MILKNIAYKVIKWFSFTIAFFLIFTTVLLSLMRFTTPYLQSHNQQIESWISSAVGYNIKIGKIEAGYFGFDPVVTLNEVVVFDCNDNHRLFELRRLSLGVDLLHSLMKRQIKIGLLVLGGAVVDVYQAQDGKIHWVAFDSDSKTQPPKDENEKNSGAIHDKFLWLLTHGKIVLNDVDITWRPLIGKIVKLSLVKTSFTNGFMYNRVIGHGNLQRDMESSSIDFSIKFLGNILENASLTTIKGDVTVGNFALNLNDVLFNSSDDNTLFTKFFPKDGVINLHLRKLDFSWNKLWEKSRVFENIDSKIEWRKLGDVQNKWLLNVRDVKFRNVDLSVGGNVNLSFLPENSSPICDLRLSFSTKYLENFSKYFPDKIMHQAVMNWLNQAFRGGEASGSIILKGKLDHFPFVNNDGSFLVDVNLSDVGFHYRDAWPMLEHLRGKLFVSGKSMNIIADSTEIADVRAYHVMASIPDLAKAVLEVNSHIYLDSEKGMRFISLSPLKYDFGKSFDNVLLQGAMRLSLKLVIPIASDTGASTKVFGAINLDDNTLTLSDWNLRLDNVYGNLNFTEHAIHSDNIRGILFDSPINLNVSTDSESDKGSKYKITFGGALDVNNLQQHLGFPFNRYLQGVADYDGILTLSSTKSIDANNTLELSSKLRGVEIYMPLLLKKSDNEEKSFKVNLSFSNDSPWKDVLVNYNNEMSAALSFKKMVNKKTQFVGGQIHLSDGGAKVLQKRGLFITANFGKVDWDEWKNSLFSENKGDIKLFKDLISQIDLKIAELRIFGQVLKEAQLSILQNKQNWLVSIRNANIVGNVFIPVGFPTGILVGKLQKMYLQAGDVKQSKKTISPKGLPNMDFVIDDFHYGDKVLGRIVFKADSIATGLKLTQLQVVSSIFQLDVSGRWEQINGVIKSFLSGKCSSKNVGNAFKQLHLTQSLESGAGSANFSLGWLGAFYDLDLPSLDGDVSVDVRKGRIVNLSSTTETEMGIGRLLNILGLQTLTRRLSLDFSDLVKNGFSFDILSGTFKFVEGDAFTKDVQLKGPIAQVSVVGRIGFADKDVDMNLTVIPQLTSSLPVIATFTGGPVVGAGVWLADKVIGKQVTKAVASYVYKVTGLWADPNIQKL